MPPPIYRMSSHCSAFSAAACILDLHTSSALAVDDLVEALQVVHRPPLVPLRKLQNRLGNAKMASLFSLNRAKTAW